MQKTIGACSFVFSCPVCGYDGVERKRPHKSEAIVPRKIKVFVEEEGFLPNTTILRAEPMSVFTDIEAMSLDDVVIYDGTACPKCGVGIPGDVEWDWERNTLPMPGAERNYKRELGLRPNHRSLVLQCERLNAHKGRPIEGYGPGFRYTAEGKREKTVRPSSAEMSQVEARLDIAALEKDNQEVRIVHKRFDGYTYEEIAEEEGLHRTNIARTIRRFAKQHPDLLHKASRRQKRKHPHNQEIISKKVCPTLFSSSFGPLQVRRAYTRPHRFTVLPPDHLPQNSLRALKGSGPFDLSSVRSN
jgi:hypothetical protein